MKKLCCLLATLLFLLAACGGDSNDANSVSADPTLVDVVTEEAPTEPAATPTDAPEPTQAPALITSTEEMVGIWRGTVAGESGYVMYTADGRFLVAFSQDALATAPRVSGEYMNFAWQGAAERVPFSFYIKKPVY